MPVRQADAETRGFLARILLASRQPEVPTAYVPGGATAFQETAADRVAAAYRAAGERGNMERDRRMREQFLGRNITPASAASFFSQPMVHLSDALAVADAAARRRMAADKATLAENAAKLRRKNAK